MMDEPAFTRIIIVFSILRQALGFCSRRHRAPDSDRLAAVFLNVLFVNGRRCSSVQ